MVPYPTITINLTGERHDVWPCRSRVVERIRPSAIRLADAANEARLKWRLAIDDARPSRTYVLQIQPALALSRSVINAAELTHPRACTAVLVSGTFVP